MRRYRVHNAANPPVSPETLDLMAQRRNAKESNDPAYKQLNVITKRAIRKDCRQSLAQRIKSAAPSDMYRQLRPVIAPKRGPTTEPSNLTPDELNQFFLHRFVCKLAVMSPRTSDFQDANHCISGCPESIPGDYVSEYEMDSSDMIQSNPNPLGTDPDAVQSVS